MNEVVAKAQAYLKVLCNNITQLSDNAVGWVSILMLNCAFIPNLIAVLMGVSDRLPSVDVVLFVWFGLALLFLQAVIRRHFVNILTIGFGLFVQATLLALIVFK